MSVNPELVRARCAEIEQSVSRLKQFQSLSREEFISNQDSLDIAHHRLLVAIEATLALCYHISARRLSKVPEEYAECFTSLKDAGLITPDLASRLQRMARFRNLLVHMYWKIDEGQVYDLICQDLDDLRNFGASMAKLL